MVGMLFYFLQRSLDLVSRSLDMGAVPDSDSVGLPRRVTEACADWLAAHGMEESGKQSQRVRRARLVAPEIVLDPWARDGLLVEFPSQQLTYRFGKVEWLLRSGSKQIAVSPRTQLAADSTTNAHEWSDPYAFHLLRYRAAGG